VSPWAALGIVLAALAWHGGYGWAFYKLGAADGNLRATVAETALAAVEKDSKEKVEAAELRNRELENQTTLVIEAVRADAARDLARADARVRRSTRRLLDSATCLREPSGLNPGAEAAAAPGRTDGKAPAAGLVPRSRAEDLSDTTERCERLGRQVEGLQALVTQYQRR